MTFEEIMEMLRNPSADVPVADGVYDDLTQAHTTALEGAGAQIGLKDEKIQALESEISRLKSLNYDLLMSSSASENDSAENDSDDNSGSDDSEPSIDRLFESE